MSCHGMLECSGRNHFQLPSLILDHVLGCLFPKFWLTCPGVVLEWADPDRSGPRAMDLWWRLSGSSLCNRTVWCRFVKLSLIGSFVIGGDFQSSIGVDVASWSLWSLFGCFMLWPPYARWRMLPGVLWVTSVVSRLIVVGIVHLIYMLFFLVLVMCRFVDDLCDLMDV